MDNIFDGGGRFGGLAIAKLGLRKAELYPLLSGVRFQLSIHSFADFTDCLKTMTDVLTFGLTAFFVTQMALSALKSFSGTMAELLS